ncbi:MAG: glycosyltransferase family 4 protein [Candidatus Omnitrophica bacterium]|nr:glycosyltransferase family 4 protein [Candidatus Omnitrophota bacterium]
MKIAILSWESLYSICVGGVGVHVTELAAALERKGNEVHVFTRLGSSHQPWYEKIHGVHYHRVPFTQHSDFVEEINNMCRSFVHTVFGVEDYMGDHFDIIHAHDWLTSNAMVWIKEGRGRKGILTIHSTEYGRCGNNFFNGRSARIRDHERHGTFCADRVITVSGALKNEIMWMYNVPDWKVNVIFNGVNPHNYDGWIDPGAVKMQYGIGPLDPVVLFSGRIVYQKGPDLLVEAIPYILKYYPHAKFVFAGDGEMRWSVEERARHIGVSHACRFLGYQNGWRLIDLYKACDCVCVPSRNEPFGIVILEAWSAGKPVVASSNGGPSEIIWHDVTGLKVYPYPESIAWGIGTLFSDFEHARWMGRNGRIAVETAFSWDVIAEQVLGVYHSVL